MQLKIFQTELGAVILLLSLLTSANGTFFETSKTIGEVDLYGSACYFPCQFISDSENLAYHIQWYGNPTGVKDYNLLSDNSFWNRTKKIQFPNSGISNCHRTGHRTGRNQEYSCEYVINICDVQNLHGSYYCHITDLHSFESHRVDSLLKIPHGTVPDSPHSGCFVPKVENITATLDQINGSRYINVSWNKTIKPRIENLTYCDFSKQWYIRILKFSSPDDVEDNDNRLELYPSVSFQYVGNIRTSSFRVPETLQRDKYYLFQLQNKHRDGPGTKFIFHNYTSYVYYFGEQVRAFFPVNGIETIRVRNLSDVVIQCQSYGVPTPTQKLLRNGVEIPLTGGTYRIHRVDSTNTGLYFCSSSNIIVNPPRGKYQHSISKAINLILQAPVNNVMEIRCAYYSDAICSSFIRSNTRVVYNSTSDSQEQRVVSHSALIHSISSTLKSKIEYTSLQKLENVTVDLINTCFDFTKAMACHSAYPSCDVSSTTSAPVPRPICKDTCDAFAQGGKCEFFLDPDVVWSQQEEVSALKESLLSKCDRRVRPAGNSPECFYVSVDTPEIDTAENIMQYNCIKGDGRGYRGDVARSASRTQCQAWSSQSPHRHSIKLDNFPVELYTAGSSCRNPGGLGERPWCYTSNSEQRWEYCDVPQCDVCEAYTQEFCSTLPGYDNTKVYVDRVKNIDLPTIDSAMKLLYYNLMGDSLSPGCQFALRQMICHTSLPFCTSQSDPAPQKICNDHCVLLKELRYCPKKITDQLEIMWSFNNLYLLDCSITGRETDECMPTPIKLSGAQESVDCFNETEYGQGYRGTVSNTLSGEPCESWNQKNSSLTSDVYPELIGAENYCRNPGQLQMAPWCITNQLTGAFGLCAIQACSDLKSTPTSQDVDQTNDWVGPTVFVFVGFVIIVIFVSIVIFVLYKYTTRKNRRQWTQGPPELRRTTRGISLKNVKYQENNQYGVVSLDTLSPKIMEIVSTFPQIPQEKIEYVKQLGQGFFGIVFKGKAELIVDEEKETYVAVKTLKEDSTDGIEAFVNEAKLMFSFNHPNIVKILGVSMTKVPYYLIFEYMDKRDLTQFLRDSASSLQRRFMNPMDRPRSRTDSTLSDDPASLNLEQLTDICKQIACGMEHLSSLKFVHRDLACRNCLVKSAEDSTTASRVIVKIGDFGLSHNLYSKDYYRVRGQAVLPIRWMSPEAIIYGKFSTAGDVWSYGVVMWEIFSFGLQPYYGTSNEEVIEKVRHGKILHKPTDTPNKIYSIMMECWEKGDQNRPDFNEILAYLNACHPSVSSDEDGHSITSSDYDYEDSDAFELNSDVENDQVPITVT